MAFNDGPHPALLIDEVLERILEYTASGEPFRTSRNLRLVCKQWQSMSFKGLCCSTSLPVIDLHHNDFILDTEEFKFKGASQGLEFFQKRLPKRISAFMAITQPRLPIEVKIGQLPLPEDVAVIREFSRSVASLRMGKNRLNPDEEYRLNGKSEFEFKLPNVRTIVVSWGHITNFQPFDRLLTNFIEISNTHVILKYVNVESHRSRPNNWPTPLPQLTHLQFKGPATDLERFITPLPKLVELDFTIYSDYDTSEGSSEFDVITEILERHSSTLQTVKILYDSWGQSDKTLTLPPVQFRELRTLDSDYLILLSKDEYHPTNLPKIKELKYAIGYHPVEVSDGLKVSNILSKSLVKLDLRWNQYFPPEPSDSRLVDWNRMVTQSQEHDKRERQILNKMTESFPPYPELLDLTIVDMPLRFGVSFVPKMVNCMSNLSRLCLNFSEFTDGTCEANLVQILTGVAPGRIQKNPRLWPRLFKQKPATITKLKNLSELQIDTSDSTRCVFGRFIFDAAFIKMKKLKILRLAGGVTAEDDMIQKWISGGREIYLENELVTGENR